jgi:hypothetical protein
MSAEDGHLIRLSGRHAKLRRRGYSKTRVSDAFGSRRCTGTDGSAYYFATHTMTEMMTRSASECATQGAINPRDWMRSNPSIAP